MSKLYTYLSSTVFALFLGLFLLTGCAKEELVVPMADDVTYKSLQSIDDSFDAEHESQGFDNSRHDGDKPDDGITDDEDDEDDTSRKSAK